MPVKAWVAENRSKALETWGSPLEVWAVNMPPRISGDDFAEPLFFPSPSPIG